MDVRIFTIQETMRIDLYWKRMSFKLCQPDFFCTANKAIFTVKLLGNDNVFKILFKPTTKSRVY